jgi:hypothetical protein
MEMSQNSKSPPASYKHICQEIARRCGRIISERFEIADTRTLRENKQAGHQTGLFHV